MNYDGTGAMAGSAVGAGGVLAMTGAGDWLWIFLAAFALIAAGTALLRIVPRLEEEMPGADVANGMADMKSIFGNFHTFED